jgi:deazaflavin-dependent oxidoreductase (nitroreductase family)
VLLRILTPLLVWTHRRSGDRFRGFDVLYLTTVGARTGKRRTAPVARFDDGRGWIVVASASGAASHPGWYHNVVAHPDQVSVEVDGVSYPVGVEQLDGEAREQAWERVVATVPAFGNYQDKTDRAIPVLRLSVLDSPSVSP